MVATAPIRDAVALVHRETGKILVFREDVVAGPVVTLLSRLLRRI